MKLADIVFSPHNDMDANDLDIVKAHEKLINQRRFSSAVSTLNQNSYNNGFRAELLNKIQNKIRNFQIYLLNEFVAKPDELFSYTEPTDSQMDGKLFWIKPL